MADARTPEQRAAQTANARAAKLRRAQERMAARLREAGWVVIPPEAPGNGS